MIYEGKGNLVGVLIMPNYDSLRKLQSTFEENMDIAKRFISLAELKGLRETIRERRLITRIRDEFGPLRIRIKDISDKLYEVGLPQTEVFIVSCFEYCLKEAYRILKGSDLTREEEKSFLRPDEIRKLYGKMLKRDVLDGDEKLLKRAKAVIQTRHVIVHRGGIIDGKAHAAFKDAGLSRGMVDSRLQLTPEDVKQDIEYLETFVKKVFDHVLSVKLSGKL